MINNFGLTYAKLVEVTKHSSFANKVNHSSSSSSKQKVARNTVIDTKLNSSRMPMWPPALYKHQEEGVLWMLKRELSTAFSGGLLCDEPGMGKTIQVGACMCQNPKRNNLLILPNAVIQQWIDTLTKMIKGVNIYVHHGKTKLTDCSVLEKGGMNVVIITIAGVTKMSVFNNITWDRIIMDECHYIKNKSSSRSIHAKKIKATIKWGLTGTPVQNSIKDLVSLFMFIKPDTFDLAKFPINKKTVKTFKKFLVLRRTKDDHPKDPNYLIKISKVNDQLVRFSFDDGAERDFYESIVQEIHTMAEAIQNDPTNTGRKRFCCMLELLIRWRQASIHPILYAGAMIRRSKRNSSKYRPCDAIRKYDYKKNSSRFNSILKVIKQKPLSNQLVFCRYTEEMNLWEEALSKEGLHSCKYSGSTSMKNRQQIINSYAYNHELFRLCDKKLGGAAKDIFTNIRSYFSNILLIQIAAGGTGLNLQQFTRVMLTTPDWNPCNEIQAVARSHRIGQTIPVDIYRFLLKDDQGGKTIDDKIYEKQTAKRMVMADVLDDSTLYTDKKISIEEIREMVLVK